MRRLLQRLEARRGRDETGVVLVIVALSMTMFMAATALSVDIGRIVVTNRQLQSVADASAMDAVSLLNGSPVASVVTAVDNEAAAAASRNGFVPAASGGPTGNTLTVKLGRWDAVHSTFTALPNTDTTDIPSAVQVQIGAVIDYVFQVGRATLARSGAAAAIPLAGFSIGSYLASFDSTQVAVLNALLGGFGPPVSLTAAGYKGLATTSIQLKHLANVDSSIGSVSNLLSGTITTKRLLVDIAADLAEDANALVGQGNASAAATVEADQTIVNHLATSATTAGSVQVCRIVDVDSSCTPSDSSAGSASVNLLSLVTGLAELADGSTGFSVTLGVGETVHVSASLVQPAVVEPPAPIGKSLSTQQVTTSLSLNLPLGNTLTIASSGAQGTATLSSVTCEGGPDKTGYGVSTNAASLTATVKTALSQYMSTDQVGGGNGQLTFPAPYSQADGQSVSTATPSVSFSFTGANQLPAPLSGSVTTTLGVLAPQIPDILSALGAAVAGATVVSDPTVCTAPSLVQ